MNEGIQMKDRRMEEVSVCLYVRHKAVMKEIELLTT